MKLVKKFDINKIYLDQHSTLFWNFNNSNQLASNRNNSQLFFNYAKLNSLHKKQLYLILIYFNFINFICFLKLL